MAERKVMSLPEAVERFVQDGDTVYCGYLMLPMALVMELVRQRKRHLELVGASLVYQATMLVLAGCADRVRTGYIQGALRPGSITERMADGRLRFEDYSNQGIALMLMAGALGIPFIPTRSFLGTDYLAPENQHHTGHYPGYRKWQEMESPFDGQKAVLLPALRPDVTIMHAQRADEEGNIQWWGHKGDARWAFWAARRLIVTVEEIVPSDAVRSDPDRTAVPASRVAAVVHCPYGAHPSGVAGFYDFDYRFVGEVLAPALDSDAAFAAFRGEWIDACPTHDAYLERVKARYGPDALDVLKAEPHRPLLPVDYGFAPWFNLPVREDIP